MNPEFRLNDKDVSRFPGKNNFVNVTIYNMTIFGSESRIWELRKKTSLGEKASLKIRSWPPFIAHNHKMATTNTKGEDIRTWWSQILVLNMVWTTTFTKKSIFYLEFLWYTVIIRDKIKFCPYFLRVMIKDFATLTRIFLVHVRIFRIFSLRTPCSSSAGILFMHCETMIIKAEKRMRKHLGKANADEDSESELTW